MKRLVLTSVCLVTLAFAIGSCGKTDRVTGIRTSHPSVLLPGENIPAVPTGVPTQSATILAGRIMPIGALTLWLEGGALKIQYATNSPWVLTATHLAVAADVGGIPVNPSGNPVPGQFPYSASHGAGVASYLYSVDLANAGLGEATSLEIAAQADVAKLASDDSVIATEGAWAEGNPFERLVERGKGGKGDAGSWAMHFTVDLLRLRGLLLWNKLGSQYEVEHSKFGPNGVINGSLSYPAGKYGNGFEPMPRTGDHNIPANFVDFPGLALGPKGCIEFWYQPDWNDWQVGHVVELFYYQNPALTSYGLACGYNDWQGMLNLGGSDVAAWVQTSLTPALAPGWTMTQPFHIAMVWDGTLANVNDRMRIFIDGADVGMYHFHAGDPHFANWDPASVLRLSTRFNPGDWDRHHWESDHGVFDNIKVWSYPKTDFSDRFVE